MLKYLKGNLYLKLQLQTDNLSQVKCFIIGTHVIHWDHKEMHAGIRVMGSGRGRIIILLSKLKINTKRSTESEFVAANNRCEKHANFPRQNKIGRMTRCQVARELKYQS